MTYKEALETFKKAAASNPVYGGKAESVKANANVNSQNAAKTVDENETNDNIEDKQSNKSSSKQACPPKPGTILKISVPKGSVLNLLNVFEVSSPGGVCIIVRLPFLSALAGGGLRSAALPNILDAIRAAGGTIEFVN